MATKKYVSLSKLADFLDKLSVKFGNEFATKTHTHSMSDISGFLVDAELSPTSTNPVQNKTIDAEFEAISEALTIYDAALDKKVDIVEGKGLSTNDYTNEDKVKLDSIQSITNAKIDEICGVALDASEVEY